MKISKGNIEEYIFDYYEGNLSTLDSNKLLDYIHHNPQFESLFSSWAMTYAHKEAKPKTYDLEAILLKKPGFQWGKLKGVVVLFLIPALIYYATTFVEESPKDTKKIKIQHNISKENANNLKTQTIVSKAEKEQIIDSTPKSKKHTLKETVAKNTLVLTKENKIDNLKEKLTPIIALEAVDTNKAIQLEIGKADTLKPTKIASTKTIESVNAKQKKNRVRKRFKIEPAKQVKPINSDF